LSVLPHIELYAPGVPHDSMLAEWQQLADQARQDAAIRGAAPFVAAQGMLARGQALQGVQLRGIDPTMEDQVSELSNQLLTGQLSALEPGRFGIVLGLQLAQALRVRVNDTVMVLAPQGSISPAGFTPRMRQFTVVGVFSSGHYEYDAALAFMNVDDAARLFRDSGNSGVRLKIADMQAAPQVARRLEANLPSGLVAQDWTQNNRTWFAAVQTEKRMMFIILTLIVAVAAFNLLS